MKILEVTISNGIEPFTYWHFGESITEPRSIENAKGYIRYKRLLEAISEQTGFMDIVLTNPPISTVAAPTNLIWQVTFQDKGITELNNIPAPSADTELERAIIGLETVITERLNNDFTEMQMVFSPTDVIVYPFDSPNNRTIESKLLSEATHVEAEAITPTTVTVTDATPLEWATTPPNENIFPAPVVTP